MIEQRGLIHETKNEFAEAKTYYKNATALSPFHNSSLQHLVTNSPQKLLIFLVPEIMNHLALMNK